MRISLIGLALAAALALSGCGGSGASSTSGGGQPAAATSQAKTSTASSSSTAESTTSSTTSTTSAPSTSTTSAGAAASGAGGAGLAGPAPCTASGLTLTYLGGQGATGHGELGFALRNSAQKSCTTGGYPGIQFLDRAGGALATTPTHTTSDFFGTLPLSTLTVVPGSSFSFRLGVSHGGGTGAGCSTAYGLQVIPPNDTATLRVDIPGGASECGATTVSPVQPGDSAFH
ncbi:MAG TPA: DUF4232 domain-containing protein [Solirubrobacteraceae bacterium]|jgi:hypothetical protein|nr:DUF4232 domain-containing protein [Solirubrobacteraceae bacterium]